jgi:superfamily I DNA/RNA helicase
MIVIQTKEFQKVYASHVETGGLYGRMANKAAVVITNLTNGLPPGVATSNNGESRLHNCVKYALNDSFRLVTVQDGNRCFVLFMGIHDKCDEWLVSRRNMRAVYNPNDQTVALVAAVQDATNADLNPPPLAPSETPFLTQLSDFDWTDIIPSPPLRFMLLQLKETDGDRIWDTIAVVQGENPKLADLIITVINHLRRGQPVEARLAVDAYLGVALTETPEHPIPVDVLQQAIRQPANADRFVVLTDLEPGELKLVLDPLKFQEWMVYLHEGQARVVNEDFDRPAVLTGVSGSGKTCVLVHRARRMAREYPGERSLVLTLNKSLARLLENLVGQICSEQEKARIDVMPFHEFLGNLIESLDLESFLRTLGNCTGHSEAIEALLSRMAPQHLRHLFRALDERDLFRKFDDFLHDANHVGSEDAVRLWSFLSTSEVNVDPVHYLYEEMELVRSAFTALDQYSGYLDNYDRPGRSISFQRNRREQVVRLLHAWEQHQITEGYLDHMGLSQAAAVAIEDRGGVPSIFKYRCVLVDEFQDFSTLDIEILQKIPKPGVNRLFFTGDIAQKIYAKELDFPKARLGPAERVTRSIRKNYRNSKQILLAADSLIRAFPPPSDGDADLKILDPELANRQSARPIALKSEDPTREAWRQAKEWLAEGNPGYSVCIATANPDQVNVEDILSKVPRGIVAAPLSGDYLLDATTVVVSDIAAIKGFEFSLIMIVGLEEGVFPYPKRPEAEIWRDAMRLYVAITRGRDEVRFPYKGTPSRFLAAMTENVDWRDGLPFEELEATAAPALNPPSETIPVGAESSTASKAETGKDAGADVPHAPSIETPADAGPVSAQDAPHKVVFLNGFPCLTIPSGLCEFQLAALIDCEIGDISRELQKLGVFLSPTTPLPDHVVRGVLERHRVLVNFLPGRQTKSFPNPSK